MHANGGKFVSNPTNMKLFDGLTLVDISGLQWYSVHSGYRMFFCGFDDFQQP